YSISKKLAVNKAALDEYTAQYIADGQAAGCINDLQDYIDYFIENSDINCEVTCSSCLESLLEEIGLSEDYSTTLPTVGEWMTFWTTYNADPSPNEGVTQALLERGFTEELWKVAYEECTDACIPTS